MPGKVASVIQALQSARNIAEIRRLSVEAISFLGFTGAMCLPLYPRWKSTDLIVLRDAWPKDWVELYNEREYRHSDPALQRAKGTSEPFRSADAPFDPSDTRASEIQCARREMGLELELAVPVHSEDRLLGLVFLVEKSCQPADEVYSQISDISAAMLTALQRVSDLQHNPLTKRELEMLHWASLGKTTDEIATIAGLTPRTVNTHFENAARKLGTGNRLHTVVQALKLKLME